MTEGKKSSRMFPFITVSRFNLLGGACQHGCRYCWAREKANRFGKQKYIGKTRLYMKEFKQLRKFTKDDFVFVCDMTDLFGKWVPNEFIFYILKEIGKSPARFLLLTKNPKRYHEFKIPLNCTCGATIETDCENDLANAPSRQERIEAMITLAHPHKMVSIEPIMDFTPSFITSIIKIKPDFVAVGYDNYDNKLTEPVLAKTLDLIETLQTLANIKVYKKTLREVIEK